MVVNENNPKIWASLIAPNPDDVTYWVDLTADPHGNIIKFYDENDEKWYNLTSPTSDYAVYPYIGPNGNWFIENKDSGVRAQGDVPDATINGKRIADNPVLTKEDIELGNVANLAPEDYPVPDAVYGLIDGKVDETRTINGHTLDADVVITKGDVGLGNVENIAPADMPISTATSTALSGKVDATRNIVAGSGLTGGGNLTADRTINVVSATDGITINADNIQLATVDNLTSTSTTKALSANQGKLINDKNIAQDAALLERPIMIDPTGDVITPSMGSYSKDESDAKYVAKTQIVQTEGTSTTNVMSQKSVTDELAALETDLSVTTDKLTELEKEIYGANKEYKYISQGQRITIQYSDIGTSYNSVVKFKYIENVSLLEIWTSLGQMTITPVSGDVYSFKTPIADNITSFFIQGGEERFPSGSVITFLSDEKIQGLKDGVMNLSNKTHSLELKDTEQDSSIEKVNNIINDHNKKYLFVSDGTNKLIYYDEFDGVPSKLVSFEYDGVVSNLEIWSRTAAGLNQQYSITDDGNGKGHFTLTNNTQCIGISIRANGFPMGKTFTILGDATKGLVTKVDELESVEPRVKLWVESQGYVNKLKTINGLSLIGDGNIIIQGGSGGDGTTIINAADYGFLPTSSADENTTALQALLDGGNKTIIISVIGTYDLNATILIDSNTEIFCCKGVVLRKAAVYSHVFMNRGASARTWNENISLLGVHIDVNGQDNVPTYASALYGLRGHISFLCAKNIKIIDLTLGELTTNQYGVQVNSFENLIIDGAYIYGRKDGIHISDGDKFSIRNIDVQTQDDALCFNTSDWESSNCVDGTVSNGIVENAKLRGYRYNGTMQAGSTRFLVGRWVDWYSGMPIKRGDRVVSNGKVYRACNMDADGVEHISTIHPSIETYNSYQEDGVIKWKLMKDAVIYETHAENIRFVNCQFYNGDRLLEEVDTTDKWNRSLYPSVPISEYPAVKNIVFEGCYWDGGTFLTTSKNAYSNISFKGCHIKLDVSISDATAGISKKYLFENCEFAANKSVSIGSGCYGIFRDCDSNPIISIDSANGRISGNSPVSKLPLSPSKGDIVNHNGIIEGWNGSSWNTIL